MDIAANLAKIKQEIPSSVTLIAVSKTHPVEAILEVYHTGHKIFGENKVQELTEKYEKLPEDIQWHLIGHLQTNKVKYIAPFVHLIHSVDSLKLLQEINKQAFKNNRVINCLLQIYIASEDTKFGLSFEETEKLLISEELEKLKNVRIVGLMGMATNTIKTDQIKKEFRLLKTFFENLKSKNLQSAIFNLEYLSMGMTSDYKIAIEEGSSMIRVGSAIFGNRSYNQ